MLGDLRPFSIISVDLIHEVAKRKEVSHTLGHAHMPIAVEGESIAEDPVQCVPFHRVDSIMIHKGTVNAPGKERGRITDRDPTGAWFSRVANRKSSKPFELRLEFVNIKTSRKEAGWVTRRQAFAKF